MKIEITREQHTRSGKKLKRARHLYAVIIKKSVESDAEGGRLHIAAQRAVAAKLWISPCHRSVRFSILRSFWRMHPAYKDTFGWHRWMRDNNWDWRGMERMREAA